MDNLVYRYNSGNQLKTVTDAGTTEGFKQGSGDYLYDDNGNMIVDPNKGLSDIKYNNLNLPYSITKGADKVGYIYDVAGRKFANILPANDTIFYSGSFVYRNGDINYMICSDGLLNINATTKESNYEFHLKDHLGNTRVAVNENNIVTQTNNYYPFGLTFGQTGSSTNKYLYNGKELQEETGFIDYGARQLDKELGRWFNLDPLAEKYINMSPYAYVGNNPANIIDPNGMDWYDIEGKITWKDNEGKYKDGDKTYDSLGKNVIVVTHNRNEDGVTEDINTATFALYLEDNTNGATAIIKGNTVPDDSNRSGTLAEGLYDGKAQSRSKYKKRGKKDLAIIINGGSGLPTVKGNPSKKNSDKLTGVFIHMGNNYQKSLHDSKGNAYSHGCLTGGNYKGSHAVYNSWREKALNFNGKVYLRSKPKTATPINNTSSYYWGYSRRRFQTLPQ